MKIIWCPAITLDGYIAKSDGDSDWVTERDGELFNEQIRKAGCVIVGRKTYEQYKGGVFPVEGATTFVWTRRLETSEKEVGIEFISGTPEGVVKTLEKKGFSEAVLAGGGHTNDVFAKFVNKIFVTIYPMTFGEGIKMLSKPNELKLELVDSQNIGNGIIRQHYLVK